MSLVWFAVMWAVLLRNVPDAVVYLGGLGIYSVVNCELLMCYLISIFHPIASHIFLLFSG